MEMLTLRATTEAFVLVSREKNNILSLPVSPGHLYGFIIVKRKADPIIE